MIILLEFLVFILILINILAPPIYLGSQLSKAFYDKRSIFLWVVFHLFATFVFPSFLHVANLLFFLYNILDCVKEKEEGSSLSCPLSIYVLSKYSIFGFDIYNTIDI